VVNLWRDNEVHSKSTKEQVIAYKEDAEETHNEETEDQEDEGVIPNFEIDADNGNPGRLDSKYENDMK